LDRLFLDANVLFSAAYGSPGILKLWERTKMGRCTLLASAFVIEEAVRNLETPDQFERLEKLLAAVEVIPDAPLDFPCPIELPDKGRPVFLAAIRGKATHLLTGDVKHFGLFYGKTIQGTLILSPGDYLSQA
jgi:predicted nucleic acid-binding protein